MVGVSLCLVGAAVFYVRDVPVRSSFLDLLPRSDPLIDEYRRNEQYLAQSDYVALLIRLTDEAQTSDPILGKALSAPGEGGAESPSEEVLEQTILDRREELLRAAAEQVAVELRKEPEFTEVSYLVDRSTAIPEQYLLLFQLDEERLARIEDSVALARSSIASGALGELPAGATDLTAVYGYVRDQLGESLGAALGQGGAVTAELLDQVRIGLAEVTTLNRVALDALGGLGELGSVTDAARSLIDIFAPAPSEVTRTPEAVLSSDRTKLLLTVRPRYPSQRGVTYSDLVMEALHSRLANVDLDSLGVTVGVTGTYSFNSATNAIVSGDMLRTTIIASIGVLVIFLLAFGSLVYSVIVTVPLLVSVVLTVAWAKLAMGGFNLVTTFLPALVLGLGIDYAIHIVARYVEEGAQGKPLNRALRLAIHQKGKASMFAAITTSLVFVGLLAARSRALFEMGAITSVGILLAFLATLFLLPALITLYHFLFRRRERAGFVMLAARLAGPFRYLTGKSRAILVVVLVLTFFVVFQAARTSFVFSSRDLVPLEESQEVLDEILVSFGQSEAGMGSGFALYASTEAELTRIVDALKAHPLVRKVDSVWDELPVNLGEQQRVLNDVGIGDYLEQLAALESSLVTREAAIDEIEHLLADFSLVQYLAIVNAEAEIATGTEVVRVQLQEVRRALNGVALPRARADIAALQGALEQLDANLSQVSDLPPLEELVREILAGFPAGLRSQYITADGRFIVKARVGPEIFDGDNLEAFDAFAAGLAEEYFGMPLVVKQLERYMKRDFVVSTALAVALIAITLWVSLGGGLRAALAATPLVLGYIWMLGGMRLLNVDFNFLSITISPLLIGIGVDNGIHILHRVREERDVSSDGAIERASASTAIPVVVTSLTTMLVFGSLLIARTPGLRFLGASALLGIGFTLVFSLLFLPAALRIVGDRRV